MDQPTKVKAQLKLSTFATQIGYPDQWFDYSSLLLSNDDYFGNMVDVVRLFHINIFEKAYNQVDKSEWFMAPSAVNAYYNPSYNQITFPAGILQPPFFSQYFPHWANFGAIGMVIGHEITHGFDNSGRNFDANGSLTDWWTTQSSDAFLERAQCVVDAYDNYYVNPDLHVNGELTEGENLADLGGLRIAYSAYETHVSQNGEKYNADVQNQYFEGFSNHQLFFLSFAQVWCSNSRDEYLDYLVRTNSHSPGQFRAIGGVSNFEKFRTSFNCKEGSKMYPKETCRVW